MSWYWSTLLLFTVRGHIYKQENILQIVKYPTREPLKCLKITCGVCIQIFGCSCCTCVFGVNSACSVTPTNFMAGSHHYTVGAVTAEVREGTHRRRVITKDDVWTVHSPSLVQVCPPGSGPCDLQCVGAEGRHGHTFWTTGHWNDAQSTPVSIQEVEGR